MDPDEKFRALISHLIEVHGGILRLAVKVGVSESTIYRWLKRGPGRGSIRNTKALLRVAALARKPLKELLE